MDRPFRFIPFLRPMVWGGRRLEHVLGKPLATQAAYGESWEVSDHPLHRSVVATGPLAGQNLHDLMKGQSQDLLGKAIESSTFPWLIKFLDANDWLSVQVHPDREQVQRLWPGEGSKTEAWFVVDAAKGSRIYAGLRPGTTENDLRAALENGTVDRCLHSFEPEPGDCIFLPAGTVHAVGGGVLIAEIQETSDATFRLFDWNRRDAEGNARKLHIDEGLASIHWNQGPVEPVKVDGHKVEKHSGQLLVRCPYFVLEHRETATPFRVGGTGQFQALIVIQGQGHFATGNTREEFDRGQVWLLSAGMPEAWCHPETTMQCLVCSLP